MEFKLVGDSGAKRGFADNIAEMIYVDCVEPGNPPKAPFVWTIEEQMEMLRGIIFVVHCRVIPASVMFLKTEQ